MDATFPVGVTVVMGKQGRLVLPAELRARLGLEPGDELAVSVVGHQVILQRPQDAVTELQRMFADLPPGRSLVDELIAERQAEVAAE